MQPKSAKLLEDIRDSVAFIRDVARGKSLGDYRTDRLFRQAVERNFEIIGEAMNRLLRCDPDIAMRVADASQIVAFRNVLIHGYDLIDDTRVWDTIQGDMPRLEKQVEALLRETEGAP